MKTQKALGIFNGIPAFRNVTYEPIFDTETHYLIKGLEDIKKYKSFPYFARPCPITPRHGFIESRLVHSADQLTKLFNEVKKEDPQGEIVLGPCIKNVTHNAVCVSSGLLSVGPGNDGATAGKNSISFTIAPFEYDQVRQESSIAKNEELYIESIYYKNQNKNKTVRLLTQVRGGPALKVSSNDYIPYKIAVTKVVTPHNDLLQWERDTKKFSKGTVVWGNGFTLASHAAVHCIINKIPFITSHKPEVGEVLRCNESRQFKLSKDLFCRGVNIGINYTQPNEKEEFFFSLAVLHNWAFLRKSPHAAWLLGAASSFLIKIFMSLAFGEFRHYGSCSKKRRELIYKKVRRNCRQHIPRLNTIFKAFHSGRNWEEGFGGIPWANCTWHTMDLLETVSKIQDSNAEFISDNKVADLIERFNRTINQCHNGNIWIDKITDLEVLDDAADNPGLFALSQANTFYSLFELIKTSKAASKNVLSNIRFPPPPCAIDKNGELVWAYVARAELDQGMLYMTIEASSGNYYKHIELPNTGKAARIYKKLHSLNYYNDEWKYVLPFVRKKGFELINGKFFKVKGIK